MQRSRLRKLARTRPPLRSVRPTLLRQAPIAAAIFAAIQGAQAQEAPAPAPGALEEVVVTATKRAENQQTVPISIQALDTRRLEEMNVQSFDDYAQQIPTVAFQTLQPGFSRTFMRGIASDNNPNHSGPLPTVGMYLDEEPITTIQGPLDLHMYDIARVEALPGPQGTLYGASSEAGTLRIITNKPDPNHFAAGYDLQGNVIHNGTAGGIAEGFVNIPLSSNAALRLVGWYERDSGYLDNVQGTLTYPNNPGAGFPSYTLNNSAIAQKHYNPVDTYGGRAALKFDLNDNWTITPVLIAQESKWSGIFGEENWYALDNGSPINQDLAVKHFYPEGGKDSWVDAALTVQGKIGNWEVTYAGAYLKRNDHTQSDYSDYSLGYNNYYYLWPANSTQLIYGADRYQMFSNELRIASPKEYPVRFVGGLFQQRQTHNIEQNYVINGLDPSLWVGAGTSYLWPNTWWLTQQQRVNRDKAVFGELNWDMTSQLTLTAGVRRFNYDNTLQGFYGFGLNAFGSNPGLLPPSQFPPGFSPSSGQQICFNDTPFQGAPCEDLNKRATGDGWTPKFSLAYKLTHDAMVYALYSKGFRPGGVNRIGAGTPPYAPDFLKNYEVGWKTEWADHTLRWNGALYYDQWDDFQFSFLGPNSVTIVANAGQARVKGGDTEIEWQATPAFNLSLGAAYTDAYLSENYCGALDPNTGAPITSNPCVVPGEAPFAPLAPTGQQLPNTPKFKGTATARYTFPVGTWNGHVQANYVYQSAVWADMRTLERGLLGQQPAYGIFNFFTGVEKNNLALELLIKNAFDKRASIYRYSECTQATCAPIAVYNVVAPPRLIGLQLSQRF
ncbi:MAG TPA: TonB-dependent receptor [Steroidobacteraceae bacterium]|nr:TonB-dependent receptor [Steroidobacteraceae bacterium]